MFRWLHSLHEWATRNPVSQFNDSILGQLLIEDSWWERQVDSSSGPVVLRVGGRYEPDAALLATARTTFGRIDTFLAEVHEFLQAEAERPAQRKFAEEIRSLRVHDIAYWWPKTPQAGMIFFEGPDELKLWHCDIDSNRLSGLVFDS